MMMVIDPRKTDEAINEVDLWCKGVWDYNRPGKLLVQSIEHLLGVARVYQATLPKPLWTVRWVNRVENRAKGIEEGGYLETKYDSMEAAAERAFQLMQGGASRVEVIAP